MNENARQLAEAMAAKMRKILERGEEAMAVCLAIRSQGKPPMLIGLPMPNEQSKDMAALAMHALESQPDIEYILFLSDAWTAKLKGDAREVYQEYGSVQAIPGRQEAIIASVFGRNHLTELGQWIYERVHGKLVFSPAMEWIVPDSAEGRFVGGHATTKGVQ